MARDGEAPATLEDLHEAALAMPDVERGTSWGTLCYRVARRPFLRVREPRADAVHPATGERLEDVLVLWVAGDAEKRSLVEDDALPFFTLEHYDGHASVLLRASEIGRLTVAEVHEAVQDAWLAQATATRRRAWLRERGLAAD